MSSLPPSTTDSSPRTLHIGTRSSTLALAQTDLFTALLSKLPFPPPCTIHPTTTAGDHNQTLSLHALAATGKSLWTDELETQLLAGEIDCIVHSLKDVPTKVKAGCAVRAVGPRADPRDVLVMRQGRPGGVTTLQGLLDQGGGGGGGGWVVGTSSVRRAAMIRRRYPGLRVKDVRGNVGTRLRKLDSEAEGYDCLVLAGAGVLRLGLGARISSWLGRAEGMMHAVGQGALGVEFREGDDWVEGLLRGQELGESRRVAWECAAERMLLGCLEGGCSVPVGVETEWEDEIPPEREPDPEPGPNLAGANPEAPSMNTPSPSAQSTDHQYNPPPPPTTTPATSVPESGILHMRAVVLSIDGSTSVEYAHRHCVADDDAAAECGWELARELVARGAGRILESISLNRGMIEAQDGA